MNKSVKKRLFIISTIVFNNRLSKYADYIQKAKRSGYQILRLCDFFHLEDRRAGKHFVLRHDVDSMGTATRKMFEVEKQCGVKSTYYFRFSTIDVPLINEMLDAGFEVGFHFETISDYIRETDCKDKNDIDIEAMRLRLSEEIKKFEKIVGAKIFSCCSHGAPENTQLMISNNVLTDNYDVSKLGVLFEAYDAEMYEKDVDCHIMDNSVLFNYGFSYVDTPLSAIDAQKQNIVFLAHPSHWYLSIRERILKLRAFCLGKARYTTDRTFHRIAK